MFCRKYLKNWVVCWYLYHKKELLSSAIIRIFVPWPQYCMDFWKGPLGFHWWLNPMFKDLGDFSLMCGVSEFCNCFILESAGSGMRFMDPVSSSLVCQSCERTWLWNLDYSKSFCFLTTVKDLNIKVEHQLTSFESQLHNDRVSSAKCFQAGGSWIHLWWIHILCVCRVFSLLLEHVESCGSWSVVMLLWTWSSSAVISAQEVEENIKGNLLPSCLGTLSA